MEIAKIYWLVDTRPSTLVNHPNGYPFYCGLARGRSLKRRLSAHRSESYKANTRRVGVWVAERDPHIRIDAVENLSPDCKPQERLRHWTSTLHLLWPDNANRYANGDPKVPGGREKPPRKRRRRKTRPVARAAVRNAPRKPQKVERNAAQDEIDQWNKQYRAEREANKAERKVARREMQVARDERRVARVAAKQLKEAERPAREAARQAVFRANSIRLQEEYKEGQRIRREAAKLPPCPL